MNPPFKGYGSLSKRQRKLTAQNGNATGRYNLAHIFVYHAMKVFKPELLVSLLPSNWVYAQSSWIHKFFQESEGSLKWEEIGPDAFGRVSTHVGILTWKAGKTRKSQQTTKKGKCLKDLQGVVVHHGVATGCDEIFFKLSETGLGFGQRMDAVRGKDVDRGTCKQIWVPHPQLRDLSSFEDDIPPRWMKQLSSRSCVRTRGKQVFEYHDSVPEWFCDGPKLLVPEIVTNKIRVELDRDGTKLPLHSTIAIRVPSISKGLRLRKYLLRSSTQRHLFRSAPRLNSGAIRIRARSLQKLPVPKEFANWRKRR